MCQVRCSNYYRRCCMIAQDYSMLFQIQLSIQIMHYQQRLTRVQQVVFDCFREEVLMCLQAFVGSERVQCFQRMVNLKQLQYEMTAFRTKKTYVTFLIAQLVLAITIVPVALSSPKHFKAPAVILLEFLLFLLLAFDLLVVRWVSEGKLCHSKSNIFDLGLLLVFLATLMFLVLSEEEEGKDYRQFMQTDDVIILVIVMSRYLVQVVRLVFVLKNAKTNRSLHNQIKKIDLNNLQLSHRNQSMNFHDIHQADQNIRNKIAHKNQLVEEN